MNFSVTDDQLAIIDAVQALCRDFDADYWADRDQSGQFPHDFHQAMASAGWLGIAMPEAYGGAGLGILEASLMVQAVAASGAGMSGASAIHMNIFGLHPVVVFGTDAQKMNWLPPLIRGEHKACFAVTEPDTGLNTLKLKTLAKREGDHYVVHGQKIWISTAQVADKLLLLARTGAESSTKSGEGLSLFYTDLDRSRVVRIPVSDRIGEEGQGFRYILHGLNPERILIAAEAVGLGRAALARAQGYARERVVFDRPIGQNQAIAHPLAQRWIELEAAHWLTMRAAWLYDQGQSCGAEANSAKFLAAEAGYKACETAVMTHGGMGYAREYHVERYFRESLIPRIAPVSRELILSFIAEKVLGLPKSY
ncbi:MAG: acyl-CoA dehydrogenase [Betaproteobacteria bacterium]|nr:acyl-CoA dehydrogenase [Betaproteobacteria bacterium]